MLRGEPMTKRGALFGSIIGSVLMLALAGCTGAGAPPPAAAAPPPAAAPPASETVPRSLSDIERFWTTTYPTISNGEAFKPVQGGYHPYTESDPPPGCGGEQGAYQPNAFYCPDGDFIAWDAQKLIPELQSDF